MSKSIQKRNNQKTPRPRKSERRSRIKKSRGSRSKRSSSSKVIAQMTKMKMTLMKIRMKIPIVMTLLKKGRRWLPQKLKINKRVQDLRSNLLLKERPKKKRRKKSTNIRNCQKKRLKKNHKTKTRIVKISQSRTNSFSIYIRKNPMQAKKLQKNLLWLQAKRLMNKYWKKNKQNRALKHKRRQINPWKKQTQQKSKRFKQFNKKQ